MTIEKKDGLFYELLIRGRWDPSRGKLGEIETYQLQTGTALIDSDTNNLVAPYAPDPARDLSKDEAIAFLGEKFSGFLDQVTSERKRADAAVAQAATDLTDAQKKFDDAVVSLTADRDGLAQKLAQVSAHLSEAAKAAG